VSGQFTSVGKNINLLLK